MTLIAELKRRNVFRVALLYIITAWLVIQVAETILPVFEVPDWVLRLVVLLFALGFIPALVFSWAYELTPEGIKRESEVDRSESITPRTGRRIDQLTFGLLILLVGFVLFDRFTRPESAPPRESVESSQPADAGSPATATGPPELASDHSIAVLAFDDFSQAGDQAHFSNGLADTILHVLAQVDGLRVAARTSSFVFQGSDLDVRTIGQRLNVATVLEGSVQKSGNRIRVIAQLIDVADGSHLWSQTFDRDVDDIFAVQDEIAESVVGALSGDAGDVAPVGTQDRFAYEAYLKGREALEGGTTEHYIAADRFLREAIEADPEFAEAHAALALNYALRYDLEDQEALDSRLPFIQRSLELNPDLALGHALLGQALYYREFLAGDGYAPDEVALIEAEYQRALELNPNLSWAWAKWAQLQRALRRFDRAVEPMVKAVAIDPMSPAHRTEYARTLHRLGRFADAREELATALRIDPTFIEALDEMARLEHAAYLRPDRALAWAEIAAEIDSESYLPHFRRGGSAIALGDASLARDIIGGSLERGIPWASFLEAFWEMEWGTTDGIREALGDDYAGDGMAFFRAIVAYREGDYERALVELRSNVDDSTVGGVAELDVFNAVASAHLLKKLGREAEADELAQLALAQAETRPERGEYGYGLTKAMAYFVLGDEAAGRVELDRLVDGGFMMPWLVDGATWPAGIFGTDYAILAQATRERQAELRANLEQTRADVRAEYARLRDRSLVSSG